MKGSLLLLCSLVGFSKGIINVSTEVDAMNVHYLGSFRVAQSQSHIGRHDIELLNTQVTIFDDKASKKYCNNMTAFPEMLAEFGNRIIIMDVDLKTFHTCFSGAPQLFKSVEYYKEWCQLNSSIILLNSKIVGFHYNMGGHREDILTDCGIFETPSSSMEIFKSTSSDRKLIGNMTLDEPECENLFNGIFVTIISRIGVGGLFLFTGIYALRGFLVFNSNQWIGKIVLGMNSLTCLYIGTIWICGSHYITDILPHDFIASNISLLSSSNMACDVLITLRWKSLNNEVTNHLPPSPDSHVIRTRKIGFCFAISLFIFDWVYTYFWINMYESGEYILTIITPGVFLILQLMMILFFFKQILFMNRYLGKMDDSLETASVLMAEGSSRNIAVKMRTSARQLNRWLRIASSSMFLYTLLMLMLQPTRLIERSCESWVIGWSILAFLRCLNSVSQIKLCIARNDISGLTKKVTPSSTNPLYSKHSFTSVRSILIE